MLAFTVPSTTRQSQAVISPEKTMPRPTTSFRVAVCEASGLVGVGVAGLDEIMVQRLRSIAIKGRAADLYPSWRRTAGAKLAHAQPAGGLVAHARHDYMPRALSEARHSLMVMSERSAARTAMVPEGAGERPPSRRHLSLLPLVRFLKPYWLRLVAASVALVVAAAMVLVLGQGLRFLVDRGLSTANAALLDRTVAALLAIVAVLALSTYARFYLVSWIGERVVADLRLAVFSRIVALSPAYFEITKTG